MGDKRDGFDFDIVNVLIWMVTFLVIPLTWFTFLLVLHLNNRDC